MFLFLVSFYTQVRTSQREHMPLPANSESVFNYMNGETDKYYESYERDITVIHFYFDSSTAFQFYREPRMTFTNFVSQVGGVLGLFLGFSLVSLVELLYWFLYRWICLMLHPRYPKKSQHSRYKKQPFDLK